MKVSTYDSVTVIGIAHGCSGLREQLREVDHEFEVTKVECLVHAVDNVEHNDSLQESEVNPE